MYSVYFFCDECSQPHPFGVGLNLPDPNFDRKTLNDVYSGRDLPPEIALLQNNYTNCPNTGKMTIQRDNNQVFLVAVAE